MMRHVIKTARQRLATRQLLALIELFCRANQMSHSRFGRNALGDPNLVEELRNGRTCRERTVVRVCDYISKETM